MQRYKRKDFGRRFDGGLRRDKTQVITDYVEGKQALSQLALKYGVNEKTIRRDLGGMHHVRKISKYKQVSIQMDTTCWGRRSGLMVIRDATRGRILWRKTVTHETIADYVEGVNWLKSKGFRIYSFVIGGMKGLAKALYPLPVQPCQFHQILIVRRYITQDPDIEASRRKQRSVSIAGSAGRIARDCLTNS